MSSPRPLIQVALVTEMDRYRSIAAPCDERVIRRFQLAILSLPHSYVKEKAESVTREMEGVDQQQLFENPLPIREHGDEVLPMKRRTKTNQDSLA